MNQRTKPTRKELAALEATLDEFQLQRRFRIAMDTRAVRAARRRLDVTRRPLALMLGVNPRTVRHWEEDRSRMSEPIARLLRVVSHTQTQ